jgi:hypothetical protein
MTHDQWIEEFNNPNNQQRYAEYRERMTAYRHKVEPYIVWFRTLGGFPNNGTL